MPVQQLRRFVPFALPVAILAAAWLLLIRPASEAGNRDAARVETLRSRLASAHAAAAGPTAAPPGMDAAAAFERQVSSPDVTAELLAHLTQLALSAGARNLFIDSTAAAIPVAAADGPQPAGGDRPDARLSLFGAPLQYSRIPMSFDIGYAGLGDFLWRLHDLPVLIEIRDVVVKPHEIAPEDGGAGRGASSYDGRVSAAMTFFVYSRQRTSVAPAVLDGARR